MSVSQMLGSKVGSPYSLVCGNNTYMTEFNANTGWWIHGLDTKCSNGSSMGPVGILGGGTIQPAKSSTGFIGYSSAASGNSLDSVTFIDGLGNVLPRVGGTGGTQVPEWKCPQGQKIIGVSGYTLGDGITTKFQCGDISSPVIPNPTTTTTSNISPTTNSIPSNTVSSPSNNTVDDSNSPNEETKKKSNTWIYILLVFVLLVVIAIIIAVVVAVTKSKSNKA